VALTSLTAILERVMGVCNAHFKSVLKCALQTPITGQDASYKLNVVSEARSGG